MLEQFERRRSFPWIFLENRLDEALRLVRYVAPFLLGKLKLADENFALDIIVVVSIEGRVATEEYISDHSYTPYVAFLVVTFLKHFWGDIVRSPHFGGQLGIRVNFARCPEVNDF